MRRIMMVITALAAYLPLAVATPQEPLVAQPDTTAPQATEESSNRQDAWGDKLPERALLRLGTTRLRHDRPECVAFSPNGNYLASAGWENTIRIWDVKTGRAHRRLRLHGHGSTLAVAFSPIGNSLATGGESGAVRLWDVKTGKVRFDTEGHKQNSRGVRVYGIAFSPDGASFATAGQDRFVRVWHSALGTKLLELEDEGGRDCHPVAFSPDGNFLASGSQEGTIRIWDVRHPEVPQILEQAHGHGVTSLVFTPDGEHLISSGMVLKPGGDNELQMISQIHLWDVVKGSQAGKFECDEPLLGDCSIALSKDGTILCSSHHDKIVVWDTVSRKALKIVRPDSIQHGGRSHGLAVSPDGKLVASKAYDNEVHLWHTSSGERVFAQEGTHVDRIVSVQFAPDNSMIITGGGDGTVRLWDAESGRHLRVAGTSTGWVRFVEFFGDGQRVAFGAETIVPGQLAYQGEVAICRTSDGEVLHRFQVDDRVICGDISKDGRRIAVTTGLGIADPRERPDIKIHVWDTESGVKLAEWSPHSSPVLEISFSSDGNEIWSLSEDQSLKKWNAATGDEIRQTSLRQEDQSVMRGALLNAGFNQVATGRLMRPFNRRGILDVRTTETGEPVWSTTIATHWPFSMTASPDGRWIAAYLRAFSGSDLPDCIGIWSAVDGKELDSFVIDDGDVSALAISPDNRRLAAGMTRGDTVVWDLSHLQLD